MWNNTCYFWLYEGMYNHTSFTVSYQCYPVIADCQYMSFGLIHFIFWSSRPLNSKSIFLCGLPNTHPISCSCLWCLKSCQSCCGIGVDFLPELDIGLSWTGGFLGCLLITTPANRFNGFQESQFIRLIIIIMHTAHNTSFQNQCFQIASQL